MSSNNFMAGRIVRASFNRPNVPDSVAMAGLFTLPVTVLCVSYFYLVLYYGQWNLASIKIHESGQYTLWETIFYFSHFAREIPILFFLAMALLCAFRAFPPRAVGPVNGYKKLRQASCLLAGAYLVFAVAGGVMAVGWEEWYWNVAQYRRRDDWFEHGGHWGYHFWHVVHFAIVVCGMVLVLRGWQGLSFAHVRQHSSWRGEFTRSFTFFCAGA
jgi:hypothetical protein